MSGKFRRPELQSSRHTPELKSSNVKQKSTNYCTPCGNSYKSEKELYEHFYGLLHQARLKECKKDFKPCCILCRKTYRTLEMYGEHLHRDSHKGYQKKFQQAIKDGKTIRQLIESKVILDPLPIKPLGGGGSTPQDHMNQPPGFQPPPSNNRLSNNNFYENPNPNYGWNFNRSQPPSSYQGNFNGYPNQRFSGAPPYYQQYCQPMQYNWNNYQYQSDRHFNRFSQQNGNNHYRPQNYHQNFHEQQSQNHSWTWGRDPYYAQRHFSKNQPPENYHSKHVSEEILPLNTTGIKEGKRQHIYYGDNAAENGERATGGFKKTTEGEERAPEADKRSASCRRSYSPKNSGEQECSTSKDANTDRLGQFASENDHPTRKKLSPQDFTFALPENQMDDSFHSDNHASPNRQNRTPKSNKQLSQAPNSSPTNPDNGCVQQSPKGTGDLGSPRNQQQLNADNLRNLVNLSCSRKDKFMLDKLMYDYDQMTLKAAMNRMGQNLVTLVDKDAAEDVIASLSAFGLLEPGSKENDGSSRSLPEKLIGQIEKHMQRSYQNSLSLDGYEGVDTLRDADQDNHSDYEVCDMDVESEIEMSHNEPGLTSGSCSPTFGSDRVNSDKTVSVQQNLDSSAEEVQRGLKKNKKLKKTPSKELRSQSELTEHCKTTSQDREDVDPMMAPVAPLKKKKHKSNSSNKSALLPDVEIQGNEQGDNIASLRSEAVSAVIDPQTEHTKDSTSKKKKKLGKSSSKSPKRSKKDDSKSRKSKSKSTDVECKKKKDKDSGKGSKKKKSSLERPTDNLCSEPEPAACEESMTDTSLRMADTSLEHNSMPSETQAKCDSPGNVAALIKCEMEEKCANDDLPDIIEEPYIKQEVNPADVIDLSSEAVMPPSELPGAGILDNASPGPSQETGNSSNVTIRALNFAIEEENIQCEIQHMERRLVEMKTAYERQLVDMKAAFERDVEEVKFTQEKLKERALFVRQQCDSLMKNLLKLQGGRAIATSLKRIFSEIPNELKSPEDENQFPLTNVNEDDEVPSRRLLSQNKPSKTPEAEYPLSLLNVNEDDEVPTTDLMSQNKPSKTPDKENALLNPNKLDEVPLRDMPRSTETETRDIPCDSKESPKRLATKRKLLDKSKKSPKKKSTKKAKMSAEKELTPDVEKEETSVEVKLKKLPRDIKKEKPSQESVLYEMFPNCKDLDSARWKRIFHFHGHVAEVVVLKMLKSHLFGCSNDGTVRKFKTKGKDNSSEMKCIATYTHRSDKVVAMEIVHLKDETFIVTASQYGTLKKFDLSTGNCLTTLDTNNEIVYMTSRWGSLFVSFFDGIISRHLLTTLREVDSFPCSSLPITCIATATEGAYKILCIGSGDQLISLKEAHSGLFIRSYALEEEFPFNIQVVKEDSYTLGCYKEQCRTIYIHKLLNGDLLQKINIVANVVCMQVISKNSILLGGKHGIIRIYDTEKNNQQLYYGGGNKTVSSLCLHHNLLISGSEDGTIEACELALGQTFVCNYGKCPARFAYHDDIVYHIKKIHNGSSQSGCLANNCDYIFQKDQADRVRHILTHVQFCKDKRL